MTNGNLKSIIEEKIKKELKVLHSREELTRHITKDLNDGMTASPDGSIAILLPLTAYHGAFYMKYHSATANEITMAADAEHDIIKFILSGSIHYRGTELSANDWVRIESGEEFKYMVGQYGVTMLVCKSKLMPVSEDPAA